MVQLSQVYLRAVGGGVAGARISIRLPGARARLNDAVASDVLAFFSTSRKPAMLQYLMID